VYIADDSHNKYEDMKNALISIFDLVPGHDSFKVTLSNSEKTYRLDKGEDGIFKSRFSFNSELLTQQEVRVKVGDQEFLVSFEEDNDESEHNQALQFFGFKIFEYIEYFMGKPDINSEESKKIKEEIKEIDSKLSEIF
jgi:hypothetical protein